MDGLIDGIGDAIEYAGGPEPDRVAEVVGQRPVSSLAGVARLAAEILTDPAYGLAGTVPTDTPHHAVAMAVGELARRMADGDRPSTDEWARHAGDDLADLPAPSRSPYWHVARGVRDVALMLGATYRDDGPRDSARHLVDQDVCAHGDLVLSRTTVAEPTDRRPELHAAALDYCGWLFGRVEALTAAYGEK